MQPNGQFQLIQAPHSFSYQTAPVKGAKKPNFLQSLFPTIGGVGGGVGGGALGGALAGSAVQPGVGTVAGGLLGALLGGAAGGAAGKVAENKAIGQGLGSGVAGQALEQGVLSAGPLRLLKAGKAAVGAGTGLADALKAGGAVENAVTAPGVISKARTLIGTKGQQMEARAGGFGVGEKVAGSPALGYYDSAAIGKILKTEGIKPGAPETRLKAVEDKLGAIGKQIDTHVGSNNTPLSVAERKAVSDNFLSSVEQQPGVTDGVRKWAKTYADNFQNQATNTKGVIDFRRGLDQQVINFNQNPQGALVDKQLAARAFRKVLSDTSDKMAPGIKNLNKSYSNLMNAQDFLKGGSKAISDQSQGQGGGGLFSYLRSNETAQSAKSRAGSAMQTLGQGGAAGKPFGAAAIAARSLPFGVAGALPNAVPNQAVNQSQNSPDSMTTTSSANIPDLSQNPADLSSGNSATSMFDPSQVEQNVQTMMANGGTLKDVQAYLQMATTINSLKAAGIAKTPKLNSAQVQQANNAGSGLTDLQTIRDAIAKDPSVLFKDALPGGGLARRLTGTSNYDAAKQNVVDVISRLRSGAAITADEAKRYMSLLPGATDSQQVAVQKLDRLQNLLAGFANPVAATNDLTSNTDLLSALGVSQ